MTYSKQSEWREIQSYLPKNITLQIIIIQQKNGGIGKDMRYI